MSRHAPAALVLAAVAASACGTLERSFGSDRAPDAGTPNPQDSGLDGASDAGDPSDANQPTDAGASDANSATEDASTACGLRDRTACPQGSFCKFTPRQECGVLGHDGECSAQPDACDDVFEPVCGCDDRTHENECEAHRRGVSVHYRGRCVGSPGSACGGPQGLQCPGGMYCDHADDCGSAGTCRPSDQVCPRSFRPVCGCNGVTYPNACFARGYGSDVARGLPCSLDPATARTCSDASECEQGEFCDRALVNGCGEADGICKSRGDGACDYFAPVCGCDGVTYASPCEADIAGASIYYVGQCQ